MNTRIPAASFFLAALAPACGAQAFRVSVSVSPFTETVLRTGTVFTDGRITASTPRDIQRLFVAHGANEVYVRINTAHAHHGGAGDHSMDHGLDRARMAASLHLPLDPELGLFGSYGDIRCQPAPDFADYPAIKLAGPWASLTLDQMRAALRAYGEAAAREILATGVHVRIWDVGNEVEYGTAGVAVRPLPSGCDASAGATGDYRAPDRVDAAIGAMSVASLAAMRVPERIAWLQAHLWPHEATLLAAVAEGIRAADPHARFSTHVSGMAATAPDVAVAFFKAMRAGGFDVAECGASFYPTSSAVPLNRLQAFKDMASAVHRELGCPVFVAEFGYPAAHLSGIFSWNDTVPGYPESADGQARFVRDLVAWGMANGVLSGIRPWGPELSIPGWGPMSLFERSGKTATARPALDAFGGKTAGR